MIHRLNLKQLQARKGHPDFMFQLGAFYYYGLRGVRRDHSKALYWLLKAVEKSETKPYELIGEIYARGYGVERNYTMALDWFKAAAERKQHSALNGIGYLYIKGQGVEGKNYTKVFTLLVLKPYVYFIPPGYVPSAVLGLHLNFFVWMLS